MNLRGKTILVACPTLGIDPDPSRWLTAIMSIQNQIRFLGMGQAFLAPYKKTWWPANNEIWAAAIQHNFDYILRVDDDIWGVPDHAIERLVMADVDVIGAAYPMRHYPYSICALCKGSPNENLITAWKNQSGTLEEATGKGVVPVDIIGFGLTLIKVQPFLSWPAPMYQGQEVCPDDTYFAQKCFESGIQQYAHMDIMLAHRDVTPVNRIYLYNATSRAMLASGQIGPGDARYRGLVELFGEDGMKDPLTLKAIKPKE